MWGLRLELKLSIGNVSYEAHVFSIFLPVTIQEVTRPVKKLLSYTKAIITAHALLG